MERKKAYAVFAATIEGVEQNPAERIDMDIIAVTDSREEAQSLMKSAIDSMKSDTDDCDWETIPTGTPDTIRMGHTHLVWKIIAGIRETEVSVKVC